MTEEAYREKQLAASMYAKQQEMFIFRTNHYWKLLLSMSTAIYAIILFPYVYEAIKFQPIPIPEHWFCIIGMGLSVLQLLHLLAETARQIAVKESMDRIAARIGDDYKPVEYEEIKGLCQWKWYRSLIRQRLGNSITIACFVLQIAVAVAAWRLYV